MGIETSPNIKYPRKNEKNKGVSSWENEKNKGVSRRDSFKLIAAGIAALAAGGLGARLLANRKEEPEKQPDQVAGQAESKEPPVVIMPEATPTEEQLVIAQEDTLSVNEILDFDKEGPIKIDSETAVRLKNYWVKRYREDPKMSESLRQAYREMGEWLPYVRAQFREEGIDENLCYLAIPESYWDLRAVSGAQAAGAYQIIPDTANRYHLPTGTGASGIDERLDPVKSARTCAKIIKGLLDHFNGDSDLALAGYNGSFVYKYRKEVKGRDTSYEGFLAFLENRANAIRKNLGEKGNEGEFHAKVAGIAENLAYPAKYHAVMQLINEGFVSEQKPPVQFEVITVERKVAYHTIASGDTVYAICKKYGIRDKDFYALNADVDPKTLKPGSKLKISAHDANAIDTSTLAKIARNKGLDVQRLIKLNPALQDVNLQLPDGYEVRV